MESKSCHWNSNYRLTMKVTLLASIAWLVILFLLPKQTTWGLSLFDMGGSLFIASSQFILLLVTILPADILCLMAPAKKNGRLSVILPEEPKKLFLRELRYWGLLYLSYVIVLFLGYTWMEQVIIQYDMGNFLLKSASEILSYSYVPLILTLQFMLGVMYTYAKQANGKRLFIIAVILNLIFIPMWLTIIWPHNIEFEASLPVIIVVLLGLFIYKLDWVNQMHQ